MKQVIRRSFFLKYVIPFVFSMGADAQSPYSPSIVYTGEYLTNTQGGLKRADTYLDNLDLALEVDAEQAFGIEGGTVFVYALVNNSNTLSQNIVGDTQVVSNIDNTSVNRLMEFWYEQAFLDNHSIKFGLFNLNSEFDVIEPAGLFNLSSHGIGPDFSQSGENGPSIFPASSLALRYYYQIDDEYSVRTAILDGVPQDPKFPHRNTIHLSRSEGALLVLEANKQNDLYRFGLGSWYYTQRVAKLKTAKKGNNYGVYGIFEYALIKSSEEGQSLDFFLRYGVANPSINQVNRYFGAGLVYSGFMPSSPGDSIGLAIADAHAGKDYRDSVGATGASGKREVNIELTYRTEIIPRLAIQPDIQYIINPGMVRNLNDALVFGLRMELTLL